MGLNLAWEASNNSQIVFSLREWKREEGEERSLESKQQKRVEAEGRSTVAVAGALQAGRLSS